MARIQFTFDSSELIEFDVGFKRRTLHGSNQLVIPICNICGQQLHTISKHFPPVQYGAKFKYKVKFFAIK